MIYVARTADDAQLYASYALQSFPPAFGRESRSSYAKTHDSPTYTKHSALCDAAVALLALLNQSNSTHAF